MADTIINNYTKSALPTPHVAGRIARVTDTARGLWLDQGTSWFAAAGEVYNVKDFGAVADGTTDDLAAFNAAIAAMTPTPRGATLVVPPGTYRLSDTLHITRQLVLQGAGGSGWYPATKLVYDAGKTGVVVDTVGTAPGGGGAQGDWSVIRDIAIVAASKPSTPQWAPSTAKTLGSYVVPRAGTNQMNYLFQVTTAGTTGSSEPVWPSGLVPGETVADGTVVWTTVLACGVWMRGRARLENFYISGFPGNGVHVVASHPIDNANGWFMIYGRIDLCSGNGIHTRGQDSNAGTAVAIDVGSCGGWGIREQSMMGNTFIGCQSAGNGYMTWAASTARVVGDKRAPKLANGFYYQVQSVVGDALTGSLEPTWPTIVGNTVVDNHVTWICQGSQSGGAYRADNAGAAPIFIGCYSEGGQQPAFLTDAALMLGGIPGAWYDPNSSGLAMLSRFYNPLVVDKLGNQGMVARLGSTVGNGVLEWQNGASLPYRIQSGLTEPLYWDFAYGNTPNYTSLRLGDGGNARLGVSELWMPRGYWFGGTQKDFGTSGRRGHETGVLDSQRVLFDAVVADNVPNVVTNNGTATINFYHNLPTYSTDGKRDVRVAVRNVAGTTVVNGAWRGRPSGVSLLELRNLSDGTNVTLTGSYTANTGVVMVLRAVIDGAGPPASATFYAIGDVVRNQNTSNGILYWVCIESGTPGRWAPVRASGDSGLVGATSFPFSAGTFDDVIFVDGAGAAKTINLPSLASHYTRRITVKDRLGNASAVNTITVTANGADTIDGAASKIINVAYGSLRLQGGSGAAPTNWSVV